MDTELNILRHNSHKKVMIRYSPEYRTWKLAILSRDGYKCTRCQNPGNIAHHIKGFSTYPELRFKVNNGTTLCQSCHKLYHYKR